MSTKPNSDYGFDGYTVRPLTEQDRPYLEMQIKADPYHGHTTTTDFFYQLLPGESAWALEDPDGRVIFYFKNSPAVRMSIQFTVGQSLEAKRRNMAGLIKGLAWIEAIFRATRFREIIFDGDGPELQQFAKRRLGFREAPHLLSRLVGTSEVPATPPRAVGSLPTAIVERGG